MVVAWVVFATLAIFAARYMKDSWGKLFGLKAWFQVNVTIFQNDACSFYVTANAMIQYKTH